MTATAFLSALRERGATVRADAGELEIKAAPEVLKPQVLDMARSLKPELLELLQAEVWTREYSKAAPAAVTTSLDKPEAITGKDVACVSCGYYCGEMALCAFCAKETANNVA